MKKFCKALAIIAVIAGAVAACYYACKKYFEKKAAEGNTEQNYVSCSCEIGRAHV